MASKASRVAPSLGMNPPVAAPLCPKGAALSSAGYTTAGPRSSLVTESLHRRQLIELFARPEDEVDLARASLLAACEEYPHLEVESYLDRLDSIADALRARLGGSPEGASPREAVAAVNHVLFEQ